ERYDQFERARNGDISIIVGPRSALFTPFPNLGLIVIDEEHETSYKSENVPKYHAVPTAIERARIAGASVVLGSATPSVDSFRKALDGEYRMLRLPNRATSNSMADSEIIDMRTELRRGNNSIISRRLGELIKDRLNKKEQTMLFINRRGMLGCMSCRECGTTLKCPHCDVSLSLHRDGKMHCHYCGYKEPKPTVCGKCGSKAIGGFNIGTEKVEELVAEQFPEARVIRMDMDTTKGKTGHEEILAKFADREADILVGTQMIVKGHDFGNVTLVGALAADMSLNIPDFRSGERTFQLLTQAVGRAGRGDVKGAAIIQTYDPEHYSIVESKNQDYEAFYKKEILYRDLMKYPPCSHMLLLSVQSEDERQADGLSKDLHKHLANHFPNAKMLGPRDATIAKINDIYRKTIYIKDESYEFLVSIKDVADAYLLDNKKYPKGHVYFDFDPINTL
nr:primosomal protein N' [Lachnospiraceae bacterium]